MSVEEIKLDPSVFILDIDEHIQYVNPYDYGLDRDGIRPSDYFVTSGDAIEKVKIMENNYKRLYNDLLDEYIYYISRYENCSKLKARELSEIDYQLKQPPHFLQYLRAIGLAVQQTIILKDILYRIKGPNCFLETEWDQHVLSCVAKNPRIKE